MTLPCKHPDDHCNRPKPCKFRQDIDRGIRQAKWVEENGKCETLEAREEGWKEEEK
jgi:hypothetical protein